MRPHFRFEDLEIWQLAKILAVKLHKLADELDKRRLYRYAKYFLNIARRSLFEDASMLMVFEGLGLFSSAEIDES